MAVRTAWILSGAGLCLAALELSLPAARLHVWLAQFQLAFALAVAPALLPPPGRPPLARIHGAALEALLLATLALPFHLFAGEVAGHSAGETARLLAPLPLFAAAAAALLAAVPALSTARFVAGLSCLLCVPLFGLALEVAGAGADRPAAGLFPPAWLAERGAVLAAVLVLGAAYAAAARRGAMPGRTVSSAIVAVAVLGLAHPPTASAAGRPPSAEVVAAGREGWFRPGEWTPLTLRVRAGDSPLSGAVYVRGEGEWTFEKHLELPAHAQAEVELLCVFLGDAPLPRLGLPGCEEVPLEARLKPLRGPERLVGFAEPGAAGAGPPGDVRTFAMDPARLSGPLEALESIDAIVVRDRARWEATVASSDALAWWRETGGVVLESPSGAPVPLVSPTRARRPHGCLVPGIASAFDRDPWGPKLRRAAVHWVASAAGLLLLAVLLFAPCRRPLLAAVPGAVALALCVAAPPGRYLGEGRLSIQSAGWREHRDGETAVRARVVGQVQRPGRGALEARLPWGVWRPLFPSLEWARAARLRLLEEEGGVRLVARDWDEGPLWVESLRGARRPPALRVTRAAADASWSIQAGERPLRGAALLRQGRVFTVGDLEAGAVAVVREDAPMSRWWETPAGPAGSAWSTALARSPKIVPLAQSVVGSGTWGVGWTEAEGDDPFGPFYTDSARGWDFALVAPRQE
ncbi:MAG: hypothetical protein HYZ53_13135 [Planctomycetes bacterium]|nr:hypothetical protein [Planctomycetota bacterium]